MKKKRGVVALVAFGLALSACSSDGKTTQNTDPKTETKTETETGKTENTREKLSLNWMVMAPANSTLPSPQEDFVKQTIEQKFNVTLTIDYLPSGTDYVTKLNTRLATGDHPDMFIAHGTESQKFTVDGLLADQTAFVTKETMPNYFKWLEESEVKNYQMIGQGYTRSPVPFQRNSFNSFYIRKDWLDKLGLSMPKTYEEFMDAMRKFTFNDPDGNGKKDTYGLSASANGGRLPYDFPQWFHYGLIADFQIIGKKFRDNQSSLELQNVLQGVKDMIAEGIVDPDWFVNKPPAHIDKAAQGKIGVIYSSDKTIALESNPNSLQSRTKSIDPNADWQPVFPFNTQYAWKQNTPGGTPAFLFTKTTAEKKPEHVKRSIEILDWLASEEGYLLTHYGQEGKHYKREGNKITLIPDAYEADIAKKGNWLAIYSFFTPEEPEVLGLEFIDPRMSERDRSILKYISSLPKFKGEPVTLSPPPGMNIGDFRKQMAVYQMKVIFEDKDASNWPKYREELMTKYDGNKIFQGYVDQINAVLPPDQKLDPWE